MSRKDDLIYEIALVKAYIRFCRVPEFVRIYNATLTKLELELEVNYGPLAIDRIIVGELCNDETDTDKKEETN